jgi:hypothetical protein
VPWVLTKVTYIFHCGYSLPAYIYIWADNQSIN